jgi:hypothetical protein
MRSGDESIVLFTRRDLLGETVRVEKLWDLDEPRKLLRKQKPNGSWSYPGTQRVIRSQENYNQIETYRNLGILVERFGFTRDHPAIQQAAEWLFSFQTVEGDFRGIYGGQYSPNYSAGIAELLVKAGYDRDPRIRKSLQWLLAFRQRDGGWAIPFRTRGRNLDVIAARGKAIEPDAAKPSSHMVTGVVLRVFAAHPTYRRSAEARRAGRLLLSSLFKRDKYPDRAGPEQWLRFSYPFWYTDLISALDSLSLLGFSPREPEVVAGLHWFVKHQEMNGLWKFKVLKGTNRDVLRSWLALATCRIFDRFRIAGVRKVPASPGRASSR